MNALEAVARLVRWATRGAVYDGLYPATVQGRNADGTIDILPDDDVISGAGLAVPLDSDPPNTTIVPAIGARCLLGFKGGDPRRPYVSEWESGGLERVGFDGGTRRVARIGDQIALAIPPSITVTGVVQGTQTIPGTPPVIVPIPATPLLTGVVTLATPPRAVVQSGNPKLLA